MTRWFQDLKRHHFREKTRFEDVTLRHKSNEMLAIYFQRFYFSCFIMKLRRVHQSLKPVIFKKMMHFGKI